jgi:hypothetical protein
MSVKPEMAFDVCWEVYRGAREVLEGKRGVAAVDWTRICKYSWRPDLRPKLKDWVADFALAGQSALAGPEQHHEWSCFVCTTWVWWSMSRRSIFWG